MAIDFLETFARLGKLANVGYGVNAQQALTPAALSDLWYEYENTDDLGLIGPFTAGEQQIISSLASGLSAVAPLAGTTLQRAVSVGGAPALGANLKSALTEYIIRMRAEGKSVKKCTVNATASALSTNVGTGTVVITTKRGDGLSQENIVPEILRLSCSQDSYTGGATQGREQFKIAGAPNTAGQFDYNWPEGSGIIVSASAISADQNGSSTGNLLTNGSAATWTGSPAALSNWTLQTGAWGTDIEQGTNPFRGSFSIRFKAGTGVNTALYQQFGSATGTTPTPAALGSYIVNFQARKTSGTITAGVLTVELVDDTSTVINDQQGVANSTTVNLTSLTTSYAAQSVAFRLPEDPPAVVRVRFRISTALTGANFEIDDLCYTPAVAAYPGGFGFAVFSGVTPFVQNDGWNITATNDYAGASYGATFQTFFDREFGMRANNLLLPSSTTPTYPNSFITYPGLVGWWPLNISQELTDTSGYDNDLLDVSATFGDVGDFEAMTGGVGDLTAGLDGLTGVLAGQPCSLGFWVKTPPLGAGAAVTVAVMNFDNSVGDWLSVRADDDSVGYQVSGLGLTGIDGELGPETAYFIVITYDGVSTTRIYRDGEQINFTDGFNPASLSFSFSQSFSISVDIGASGTMGISSAFVMRRLLTQAQILSLMSTNPTA